MRPVARLAALAVVASVLVAPAPGQAFHQEELPLLHSGSRFGSGWFTYSFSTDGAMVATDVVARNVRLPIQAAIYVYDQDNRFVSGFTLTKLSGDTGVLVDATVAGQNVRVDLLQPQPTQPEFRLGLVWNDPEASGEPLVGTFKQLVWVAGSAGRTEYALRGDPGAAFGGNVRTGSRTFLYTSEDFTGTANLQAGVGAAEARVQQQAYLDYSAFGTLIGAYAPVTEALDVLSVDTPSGSVACACSFRHFVDGGSVPPFRPGGYRFHLTGASVAPNASGEVILGGADVIPPL